jgi:hypothetical protein
MADAPLADTPTFLEADFRTKNELARAGAKVTTIIAIVAKNRRNCLCRIALGSMVYVLGS